MTKLASYATILSPLITEKTTKLTETNQVVFRVPLSATKPQIKLAVEELFPKIKVLAVNTLIQKGKKKLFRGRRGERSDMKKAIVTLREGDAIDVTTGI
jgi:large subunit ribosomal protein L23